MYTHVQRTESTGHIHVRSADPMQPPEINFRFLETAYDRQTAVAAVRRARDIAAQSPLREIIAEESVPGPQVESDEAILQTINDNKARLTINGVYAKLPAGDYTVAESWSGDIVGAQWYLPRGTGTDVLGFWRPETGKTMIGNDLLAIPTAAKNPRLAHEFINFFLDEKIGYENFVNWNGYQPPFTSIDPTKLIADGVVPDTLASAVVTEDMFKKDLTPYELTPTVDQMWLDAWTEIKAGA